LNKFLDKFSRWFLLIHLILIQSTQILLKTQHTQNREIYKPTGNLHVLHIIKLLLGKTQ